MKVAFVTGSRALFILAALCGVATAQQMTTDQFLNDIAAAELNATRHQLWLDTSTDGPTLRIYQGATWHPCRRTSDPDVWLCSGILANVRTGNVINLPPEFMRGAGR